MEASGVLWAGIHLLSIFRLHLGQLARLDTLQSKAAVGAYVACERSYYHLYVAGPEEA